MLHLTWNRARPMIAMHRMVLMVLFGVVCVAEIVLKEAMLMQCSVNASE
jgi:hypothetical protein